MLLGSLVSLMAAVGWLLAGSSGLGIALVVAGALTLLSPSMPTSWWMRRRGARPLGAVDAPTLVADLQLLARRAGIAMPQVYLLPEVQRIFGSAPNAMTMGQGANAAIGVNASLLRLLRRDELAAVLAHEIAHLRNGDLFLMRATHGLVSVIRSFSSFGVFVALITLPLALFGYAVVPFSALLLLLAAPLLAQALRLGLSRTREFAADLESVRLTGNPEAMARALRKLEAAERRSFWSVAIPAWLRTHPATHERIARLRQLDSPQFKKQAGRRRPQRPSAQRRVVVPQWISGRPKPRRLVRRPRAVVSRPAGWFDVRRFV